MRKFRPHISARTPAITAIMVALLIAVQYVLSFVPGVELVTVTFVAFCWVFGAKRGMLTATSFALVRQLIFGFVPTVLALYLVYFNLLALVAGRLGQRTNESRAQLFAVCIAMAGTVLFTLMDNVLTPLWNGFSLDAFWIYFKASIPFAVIQTACAGLTTSLLFPTVSKIFSKFAD